MKLHEWLESNKVDIGLRKCECNKHFVADNPQEGIVLLEEKMRDDIYDSIFSRGFYLCKIVESQDSFINPSAWYEIVKRKPETSTNE